MQPSATLLLVFRTPSSRTPCSRSSSSATSARLASTALFRVVPSCPTQRSVLLSCSPAEMSSVLILQVSWVPTAPLFSPATAQVLTAYPPCLTASPSTTCRSSLPTHTAASALTAACLPSTTLAAATGLSPVTVARKAQVRSVVPRRTRPQTSLRSRISCCLIASRFLQTRLHAALLAFLAR